MMRGQEVAAFIAALLGEGVSTGQVQRAVDKVLSLPFGAGMESLAGDAQGPAPLVRSFMFEQQKRLERAVG